MLVSPHTFTPVAPPAASWKTEHEWTPSSSVDGWSNFTVRYAIAAYLFADSAGKVRLIFSASSTEGLNLQDVHIGKRAASGDLYDFAAAPTQVKFGGATSFSIAASATVVSDPITLACDLDDDLLISAYCPSGAGANDRIPQDAAQGWLSYYVSGTRTRQAPGSARRWTGWARYSRTVPSALGGTTRRRSKSSMPRSAS